MKTKSTIDISAKQPVQARWELPASQAGHREAFYDYSRKINRSLYNLVMLTINLSNDLSYFALTGKPGYGPQGH